MLSTQTSSLEALEENVHSLRTSIPELKNSLEDRFTNMMYYFVESQSKMVIE